MKLVTYRSPRGPRAAVLGPSGPVDLADFDAAAPSDLAQALARWDECADLAARAAEVGPPLANPELLAPLPNPGKILCIGLNYADHARESGVEPPSEPVVFNKLAGAIVGPDAVVTLPRASEQVDFEAELVAVIGRRIHDVDEDVAGQAIFGYCCGHDVSARDWQLGRPGKQWLLGKSFPGFAPLGPHLATADEISDPLDLRVRLRLGGETMQDSRTDQLIFSPAQIVAHVARVCVLEPGDVIFTGTPPGVGMARQPPRFLRDGDVTEVEIDGLGVLRTTFRAEA